MNQGLNTTDSFAVWKFDALQKEPTLQPVELSRENHTLDQVSSALPGGAYTTFRTYQRQKALRLQDHLKRLEQTARLAGFDLPIQLPGLRSAIRQGLALHYAGCGAVVTVDRSAAETREARLRLTIDLETQPGQAYLVIGRLHTPSARAYQQGVRVITVPLERQLPEAKLTRFIERSGAVRRALPADVNEALMIDHTGRISEGLSSNFFAVIVGKIHTAGQGVLAGVTRALTLDCIAQLGLPLTLEPILAERLFELDEAFITSASRGVLPIRQIDQMSVGALCPGALTRRLMTAFDQTVADQLLPI